MASLSFKHIYKKYPGGVTAVSDFCLEVKDKSSSSSSVLPDAVSPLPFV